MQDDGYKVGYKRPPRHSQFKPGQSGNPKGAPKHTRSLPHLIARELDRRVHVTENGHRKRVAKREVFAKQIVNDGLAGQAKARQTILEVDREVGETMTQVAGALMRPVDQKVRENLIRRVRAAIREQDEGVASSPDGAGLNIPDAEQP